MSFVDSILDDGGPVLVMEIMPLGNLSDLDKIQKLSLEEMRLVLRQTLQALAYLHEQKNITHRDIKPENILVRSRTPDMHVKLCDFGLSTHSSLLRTHCGTSYYAAAEIFTGSYTNSVDVWSIGVIGYQFIKGLPKHSKSSKAKDWSEKIRRTVERADCQGNDPVVRLLKSMLELNAMPWIVLRQSPVYQILGSRTYRYPCNRTWHYSLQRPEHWKRYQNSPQRYGTLQRR